MIYLQLFLSFLKIGLFSFGGGYATLPLIQTEIVTNNAWLSMSEFVDLITISQMTPGPIAINSATFVGIKIAGPLGAIVATLGCILPSCIIVSLLAYFYLKYRKLSTIQDILWTLRPAVVAMIASAGVGILLTAFFGSETSISISSFKLEMTVIFIFGFVVLKKFKCDPVFVMLLCGVCHVGLYYGMQLIR